MPGTIPDPSYYPPSLDLAVGASPASVLTDLGGGIAHVSFLKANFQASYWNSLKVNQHFVVNHEKVSSGLIIGKATDADNYLLEVQHDPADSWANGDPLVPQFHEYILHFSNAMFAVQLARPRDTVLGWIDAATWGVLQQAIPYDPIDAEALHINSGDDLDSTDDFDVQSLISTGRVLNICRSSDPPEEKPFGLSDDVPPLHINWAVTMTLRAALDIRECSRAQQEG